MLRIEGGKGRIRAGITLPGSKSISNRVLLLSEVTGNKTEWVNLSTGDDTRLLMQAIEIVKGTSLATLDIGQAGTDMRFLTAWLAAKPGRWILTGTQRMKERPIAPLVDALRHLGASIEYPEKEGYPPLKVLGTRLKGGTVDMEAGVSSQFVSALLLIAPLLGEPLTVSLRGKLVSKPYIDMTLGLLSKFGYPSRWTNGSISVFPPPRTKKVRIFAVESDWSAASYFYSLCALGDDISVELRYLKRKTLQADGEVARLYRRFGVNTIYRRDSVVLVREREADPEFEHDFSGCPDLAQTVMVTCFGLGVKAHLKGLATLRIKETDRISAMSAELGKLGCRVKVSADEMFIEGGSGTWPEMPVVNTYNDHRMAMSFAPLAARHGRLFIRDHRVVSKSYPAFWEDLQALGFTVILQP